MIYIYYQWSEVTVGQFSCSDRDPVTHVCCENLMITYKKIIYIIEISISPNLKTLYMRKFVCLFVFYLISFYSNYRNKNYPYDFLGVGT